MSSRGPAIVIGVDPDACTYTAGQLEAERRKAEDVAKAIAAGHPSAPSVGARPAWHEQAGPYEPCQRCAWNAAIADGLCFGCARRDGAEFSCDPVSGRVRPAESDDREASATGGPGRKQARPVVAALRGILSRIVGRWSR